jgi:uncharacterized protein
MIMLLRMRSVLQFGEQPHWKLTRDISHLLSGRKEIASFGQLDVDLTAKQAAGSQVSGEVDVAGSLQLDAELVCSRCLSLSKQTLTIPFHERFTEANELNQEEDEEEDEIVHFVKEDQVDLAPYVDENVLLALPYVPLCDEQCRGLCPECGHNLNEAQCECKVERIDPRLAGLADFKFGGSPQSN